MRSGTFKSFANAARVATINRVRDRSSVIARGRPGENYGGNAVNRNNNNNNKHKIEWRRN